MDSNILQIIDVNLNRTTEGLRVVEDVVRFIIKDEKLSKKIKDERHKLCNLFNDLPLSKFRNVEEDFGKDSNFDNLSYKNLIELVKRNFRRAEEGSRVLEEFSKLINKEITPKIKEIRFNIYEIEKNVIEAIK